MANNRYVENTWGRYPISSITVNVLGFLEDVSKNEKGECAQRLSLLFLLHIYVNNISTTLNSFNLPFLCIFNIIINY